MEVAYSLNRSLRMSISLELPPELEREISTEASRLNLPVSEYTLRVLTVRSVLSNPQWTDWYCEQQPWIYNRHLS